MDQTYQAKAPEPIPIQAGAFENTNDTAVYWLTGAGIMLNSHGTVILVDPILSLLSEDPPLSEVEGVPQYAMPPIAAKDVVKADAVLYTHADPDHFGDITIKEFVKKGLVFHGPSFVAKKLQALGVPEDQIVAHAAKSSFPIGTVNVQMTVADHPWQIDFPDTEPYVYKPEDCCGFKFYTPDGIIWDPGDSRLLQEHFDNGDADLVFMDFEDNSPAHHFGTENALKLVNTLSADIIMYHWGTYYAPEKPWYAFDPATVKGRIDRPERILWPHPGEKVPVRHRTGK